MIVALDELTIDELVVHFALCATVIRERAHELAGDELNRRMVAASARLVEITVAGAPH